MDLSPVPIRDRPLQRLLQLFGGLALYGLSMALMVRSQLGANPWDVLHQGLRNWLHWSFGAVTALTGVLVLLVWFPLRQRPGIGTVANVAVIAVAVDAALAVLPVVDGLAWQILLVISGVVLNGFASATYVGARLGPGPRDGLMTGLHTQTGLSIRMVRTGLEIVVVSLGWLLGGTAGFGTLLYALAIGPVTQFFLPLVAVRPRNTDGPSSSTSTKM